MNEAKGSREDYVKGQEGRKKGSIKGWLHSAKKGRKFSGIVVEKLLRCRSCHQKGECTQNEKRGTKQKKCKQKEEKGCEWEEAFCWKEQENEDGSENISEKWVEKGAIDGRCWRDDKRLLSRWHAGHLSWMLTAQFPLVRSLQPQHTHTGTHTHAYLSYSVSDTPLGTNQILCDDAVGWR